MNKFTAAFSTVFLMLGSTSAFAQAKVSVAHFAPFADTIDGTAVNISINGAPVDALQGVTFKQFTGYLDLPEGDYLIEVFPVGAADPAITGNFSLADGVSYTVYAAGDGVKQPLVLNALVDDTDAPADGNLNIRIVHAAPFAADLDTTEVSIRTADGMVVNNLVGVPYGGNSGFFQIPAATYDLKVASNDGSVNYIDPLPVPLPADLNVTVFAVGDIMNQPLGIIATPVGELPLRVPVDNSTNGTWNILEGAGTGFVFQPIPAQNRVIGQWYEYDAEGNPIFYTFDSCQQMDDGMGGVTCSNPGGFDGVMATTDLYLNTGGGSSGGANLMTTKIGELDFEFPDGCLFGEVTVRIDGQMDMMLTAANLTAAFCND